MKKYFDIEEVHRHNKLDNCWILCKDKVYDITNLIEIHPGGKKCFMSRKGCIKDCLTDYNFHSVKSKQKWEKYHIGYLKRLKKNVCIIV